MFQAFAGSDACGRHADAIYTLIETMKLSGVDPRAWPVGVWLRLPDHPAHSVAELRPWNSAPPYHQQIAA